MPCNYSWLMNTDFYKVFIFICFTIKLYDEKCFCIISAIAEIRFMCNFGSLITQIYFGLT